MDLTPGYEPRGRITPDFDLSRLTWLRVGGAADHLFLPKDEEDLAAFLAALPPERDVFPMGVGSNLIVRDGGVRAVVIRLGPSFAKVSVDDEIVTAGAGALDKRVAIAAAEAGRDLTFLRTIPGAIGGAVRMNAGCYGTYVADHLISARAIGRGGETLDLTPDDLSFAYRDSHLPDGAVLVEATFRAPAGDPDELMAKMEAQLAKRAESQPVDERTAGSTFRNPAGYSSTGEASDTHEEKAWKVIDEAGMRGARRGGAQMSEMHPNFLINTGDATAADLEGLGEEVRARVRAHSGHELTWEVKRIGEPL